MVKRFSELITEKSIRQKKRDLNFTKNYFVNGTKKYKGIASFGIITPENPLKKDLTKKENFKLVQDFKRSLKNIRYSYININGHYGNNIEHSFLIFNITINELCHYAGKYNQESFFYCYVKDNNMISEYWQLEDNNKDYNEETNTYILINTTDVYHISNDFTDTYSIIDKDFKFNIDSSIFDKVNEKILENANNYLPYSTKDNIEALLEECSNIYHGQKHIHLCNKIYGNI